MWKLFFLLQCVSGSFLFSLVRKQNFYAFYVKSRFYSIKSNNTGEEILIKLRLLNSFGGSLLPQTTEKTVK